MWLNQNLAGSFAQSSLRPGMPPLKVVAVRGEGAQARYSLYEKHWQLARTHLAYGDHIPVVPLAVFLYRDYGVTTASKPDAGDLVEIFRYEFGYDTPEAAQEFNHLYVDDRSQHDVSDWFEPMINDPR